MKGLESHYGFDTSPVLLYSHFSGIVVCWSLIKCLSTIYNQVFYVIPSFLKPIYIPLNQAVIRHHFFIQFQSYIIISHLKQQLFYQEETAANTAIPLNYH